MGPITLEDLDTAPTTVDYNNVSLQYWNFQLYYKLSMVRDFTLTQKSLFKRSIDAVKVPERLALWHGNGKCTPHSQSQLGFS